MIEIKVLAATIRYDEKTAAKPTMTFGKNSVITSRSRIVRTIGSNFAISGLMIISVPTKKLSGIQKVAKYIFVVMMD